MTLSATDLEFANDVMITAVEGGTGYWARLHNIERDEQGNYLKVVAFEWENVAVDLGIGLIWDYTPIDDYVLNNPDLVPQFVVSPELLFETCRKFMHNVIDGNSPVNDYFTQMIVEGWSEKDAGAIDADGADILFQLACFGEVVYG